MYFANTPSIWLGLLPLATMNSVEFGFSNGSPYCTRHVRHVLRHRRVGVAGRAAHALLVAEVVAVDRVHHADHEARLVDHRRVDRERVCFTVEDLRRVAAGAVLRGCRGEHAHRVDELVDRNALENPDVLEERLGHRRGLSSGRWGRRPDVRRRRCSSRRRAPP